MSDRARWLHLQRVGGIAPSDDEELSLSDDGTFNARRTIGGRRIGLFTGKVAGRTLNGLRAAAEAVEATDDLVLPTPRDGATETLTVGGRTLRTGSNEVPPNPWRALIGRVRELLKAEVVNSPRAAVELVADARTARLVHAGDGPIDVDLGSVLVKVIRVADEGGVLGRWNGRPEGSLVDNGETLVPTPRWVTAGPGWSAPLPFDHLLELAPGDMLQVWVDVPIRDGEGERAGRLYVPVLTDA